MAKGEELIGLFGTDNVEECCKQIVEKGDLQLSAAERKQQMDAKKAEIINIVHRNYIDPKTQLPHPV